MIQNLSVELIAENDNALFAEVDLPMLGRVGTAESTDPQTTAALSPHFPTGRSQDLPGP
jgi:hypothetical protein